MKFKLFSFIFFLLFSFSLIFSENTELVYPLVPEIMSSIPLKSEESAFKMYENEDSLVFSIRENDVIHYWEFKIGSLEPNKLKKFLKTERGGKVKKTRNYSLKKNKGILMFFINGKKKWKRRAPNLEIIDYIFDGKYLVVIFQNGFLNVYKRGGDLIYWRSISPESFFIYQVRKGFFVFSPDKYYFFYYKKSELKEGKTRVKLKGRPIIKSDRVILWGLKSKEHYFSVVKLYPKIGVWCDTDKNEYFKGDTLRLTLKIYNIEKVKTTVKTVFEGKENLEYKNSKKKEFKVYLPFEGVVNLKVLIRGENFSKKREFKIKVYDKDKLEGEIFYEIINNIIKNNMESVK